jgi:hypothetical protein
MAPREHGKTSTMVCFILYCLGLNSKLRIKYVSGAEDLAMDVCGQVKKNIERNEKLHEIFPNLQRDTSGSWSGSALDVIKVDESGGWDRSDLGIKDANLQAYGVTAAATGGRADIIIFDDIIRGREAIQEPARLVKITAIFYTDWLNIGGKRHIVVGTPWTPDDIHAQLSNNEQWSLWKKPAIINSKPMWPEWWTIEKLMARKALIGDVAFDLQFMLTGIIERTGWWTKSIIDSCKDHKLKYGINPFGDEGTIGKVMGFDPAASLKQTGSYSCIFVIAYDQFKRKAVIDIERKRGQPRDIAAKVVEMQLTHKCNLIYVEDNSTQRAFLDLIDLVAESMHLDIKMPLKAHFTGSNKWNPEVGLPRMVGDMQNKHWIIPWGDECHEETPEKHIDPLHDCRLCQWIKEMLGYPYDTPSTDMIMASWLACTAIDAPKLFGDLPSVAGSRRTDMSSIIWG